MTVGPLSRPPTLRESLCQRLRELLAEGAIAPGTRINEVRLASELGVSATPLREALWSLLHEGCLVNRSNRGFSAAPLRAEDWGVLAEARGALEAAALRMSGPWSPRRVAALARMEDAEAWHGELTRGCANPWMQQRLDELRRAAGRYEGAYRRAGERAQEHQAAHVEAMIALRAGDLERAAARLQREHQEAAEAVAAWLRRAR